MQFSYSIEDFSVGDRLVLEFSDCERDLGVLVARDLSWSRQVESMVAKANRVLGLLTNNKFTSRDLGFWRSLYMSLVRPHLEYASII